MKKHPHKSNKFILLILVFISFIIQSRVLTADNKQPAVPVDPSINGLDNYSSYESEYSLAEAWDMYAAFLTGVWIPTDEAGTLGSKLQMGFNAGGKRCNFEVNLSAIVRMLPSAIAYTYENDGVLYETNKYLGWYFGLDVGYEIIYFRGNGILLLSGIGWEGFSANPWAQEPEDMYNISSVNFNFGLGYRYYIGKGYYNYWEFDCKYNFIDYKNPGGTDLSGNAFSVLILYGVLM